MLNKNEVWFIIVELTLFVLVMILLIYPPLLTEELGEYICWEKFNGTYREYYDGRLACNYELETQRFNTVVVVIKESNMGEKYDSESDRQTV